MARNIEAPNPEEQKNLEEKWNEGTEEELKSLKQRQYTVRTKEDFTSDDRERLLFLQNLQEKKLGMVPLSPEEKDEMRGLQKEQVKSKKWTPEMVERLKDLHERMGK